MSDYELMRRKMVLAVIHELIEAHLKPTGLTDQLSDGYHTFSELYEFRKLYNAALFNEWANQPEIVGYEDLEKEQVPIFKPKYNVHKSWRHYDGEECFGGGWFVVVAVLPTGQITNHYEAKDWDLFKIPDVHKALVPFDGHTAETVMHRLRMLLLT